MRPLLKGFVGLTTAGILGVTGLLGFLWLEHGREVALPVPTGPFTVGRAIEDWTDPVGMDSLAPVPGTKRELIAWIWYPSAAGPSVGVEDYLPARLRPQASNSTTANVWTLLTRDVTKVRGHSVGDVDVSPESRSYPVAIMRAGASAPVLSYSTLAEDLASHGYVVVGFDAPYRTEGVVFPDGRAIGRTERNNPETCQVPDRTQMERCASRIMAAWTGDIAFVVDHLTQLNESDPSGRLTGRLDMSRVGIFGHSLGGAVAAQFCHEDARCKAGIDIDGALHGSVIQTGLRQPFMFLLSDHGNAADSASMQIKRDIQSVYDRIPPDRRLRVAIRGAFHFTFSDDGALLKSSVVRAVLRAMGALRIDARRQLAVTAFAVHRFFDQYLKGAGDGPLQLSSPRYPEIEVLE